MARKVRSGLETRTARLKRPMAKKPEFVKIALGIGLGYRRNATAGTWVVRVADGKGANWTKAIGSADDYEEANGSSIFDYWQAQERAQAVAAAGKGGTPVIDDKPTTLRAALDQYEADLKTRGGDVGNAARVLTHLSEKMLDKLVVDLTLNDLRKWRDQLTSKARRKKFSDADEVAMPNGLTEKTRAVPPLPLAPSGVNRVCTIMKAALNLAADRDGRITNRRPWEQGLATLPDAEESRNVILSDYQVRLLVDHSQIQGAAFALLVEGLASTGARVSQLARVNVGDMQDGRPDPRLMMPSSRKGNGRKTILRRPVPISSTLPSDCGKPPRASQLTLPCLQSPPASGGRSRITRGFSLGS